MEFSTETIYRASLEAVQALLLDPKFAQFRADAWEMKVDKIGTNVQGITSSISVDYQVDATKIAPQAAPFTGPTLTLTLTETFTAAAAAGTDTGAIQIGTFSLCVQGAPVIVEGKTTLRALTDETTLRQTSGKVTVKVPIFGAKIESGVTAKIKEILNQDSTAAAAYLAGN